jgi:SAM-dependent methyltransferase
MFEFRGYCPICEAPATFCSPDEWFRDHLICSGCGSMPRERALMKVISDYCPNYREVDIHESSPGDRGASIKLRTLCRHYSSSQYYRDIPLGSINWQTGQRCEDLEQLSFGDNTFDLFITQDVVEHIFEPEKAFREIARVLKPGGAHIFTVPLINKTEKSQRRASRSEDGEIIHHHPPEYHGNPADAEGSLVTMHWGYDIKETITQAAETPTQVITIDDIGLGIRAEYIDVIISHKPLRANLTV